jgi:uncharacterized protein YpiB (UPF0302 family)
MIWMSPTMMIHQIQLNQSQQHFHQLHLQQQLQQYSQVQVLPSLKIPPARFLTNNPKVMIRM